MRLEVGIHIPQTKMVIQIRVLDFHYDVVKGVKPMVGDAYLLVLTTKTKHMHPESRCRNMDQIFPTISYAPRSIVDNT
jgi:hypothetical protein